MLLKHPPKDSSHSHSITLTFHPTDQISTLTLDQNKSNLILSFPSQQKGQKLFFDLNSFCFFFFNQKQSSIKFNLKEKEFLFFAKDCAILKECARRLGEQYLMQENICFNLIFSPSKGGFSTVYLIKHKSTGEKYAAKVFSKGGLEKYKNGKQCLLNEIVLMRNCEHKYVLRLIQIYEQESAYYAILQLVDGGDLLSRMKKQKQNQKLKEEDVKLIFRQILKGMKCLHDKHIIHRDLKPSNIFFKNDSHLVIGDFGLATSLLEEDYLIGKCGTPGYAAPQMFKLKQKKGLSTSVDVFSLGVILYEMLSGNSLFDSKDYNEVMELNRQGIFKIEGVSQQAREILEKMLDLNPSKRPTVAEIIKCPYLGQQFIKSNTSVNQQNLPPSLVIKGKDRKSSIDYQNKGLLNPRMQNI